ncbi:MAG: S-layer homology domain-containing protein, partial [bacterium]|nr:S-layer homology domain-containing protein [bacterium]
MKKLLTISLFVWLSALPAYAASFPDVPEDHANYEAIEFLDFNEIISGYEDGTFNPDGLVNRAEALKIIVGAMGVTHDGNYSVLFPDVPKDQWFFEYVMAAEKAGIVGGYEDGKFKPEETINLAETLKILILASGEELPDVSGDVFVDVAKDAWFAQHLLYARNHNIVLADDYGSVHPAQAMTRSAFSEVVFRMMIVLENGGDPFPLYKNWDYFESDILPFKIKYDDESWEVIDHGDEVVFLKPDKEFLQFSPNRIYPNSALVEVTLDENTLSMVEDQYFNNIKSAFSSASFR